MDRLQGTLTGAARASGALAAGLRPDVTAREPDGAAREAGATSATPRRDTPLRPTVRDRWSSTLVIGAGLAAAMLLAVVAALFKSPGDLLILAVLTVLGMTGVFFLFGMSVGLVQFGFRDPQDVLDTLVMRSPDGLLLVGADGATLRTNPAFSELAAHARVGSASVKDARNDAGLHVVEALFQASGDGEAGFFRLVRAARIGQAGEETVHIPQSNNAALAGTWRVSITALLDADGVDRAVEWRMTRLADDAGSQDVHGDTLARDAASYETLPVGTMIVSREGRVLSANARVRGSTGITIEGLETQGIMLSDVLPDLQTGRTESTPAPVRFPQAHLRNAMGAELPCEVSASARDEATGRIVLTISERSGTTQSNAVNLSESQGAKLFNAAPIAIAVVDATGEIESANDAFARMFDTDSSNLIESVSPDSRDQVLFALNAAPEGDLHPRPVEIAVGPDGVRKGRVFISPAHPDGAEGDTAIVYAIDMTKQRELEAQFAQSQKMQAVGQLAGGMAHDFNNLLTIITLSSDFLLSSHQKSDPAFKDIMQIKQVAGRAAEIVKQLLAFSRQQTLLPEVLSLTDEISDWTTTLRPLLGERVTLDTDNGRDLWMVKADKSQLGQVIVNLAVNARDAMPEDGALTIRTRNVTGRDIVRLSEKEIVPGDYVLCEVSDTGAGMSDAVRDKIFDPFFSTKDVGKGTGLGLSTVYGIIKQTGGYIFCDSRLGEGTTFRIYLPRHEADATNVTVPPRPVPPPKPEAEDMTGSGVVLLVEDEEPVRRLAARALTRQGFEVLEAGSGVEALEVLSGFDGTVDLVVSDIVMPEMDGPTLLKELRRIHADMKLIFISGYAEDALQTLNPDEEFAFLPKPFQLADLVAKVKDTLGR